MFSSFVQDVPERDLRHMNLLVTNTYTPQAYDIIRALRPSSKRIVVTMHRWGILPARFAHAANSRLVDKRYVTASPVSDWFSGNIQKENTAKEEIYIRRLLDICDKEKIDVIYPSCDPHVYILSKNKQRFLDIGVLIPVPEYEILMTVLDKSRTIQAAQEAGFPCPKTRLLDHTDDLPKLADEIGFPIVIKPRFTLGGKGMEIAKDMPELLEKAVLVTERCGIPLVQEFIPGGDRESIQFLLDRSGNLKFAFKKKRRRKFRVTARLGTVSESAALPAIARDAELLFKKIGWWGAGGIETIYDPRDNLYKLMEINPRFPRQLWNRLELGINEPLMCLQVLRDDNFETVKDYPLGTLFVNPVEDIMLFGLQLMDLFVYHFRTGVLGMSPLDHLNRPLSLKGQVRSFFETYCGHKRRIFDPYFKYLFRDPITSLLWWSEFSMWILAAGRQLGR
jgi:biotin carboxylase